MVSGGTSRLQSRAAAALVAFALVAAGVGAWPSIGSAVSLAQPEGSPVASGDDKKPEPLPDEAPEAEEAPVADEDPCGRTFTYWDGDAQRTVTLCDEMPDDAGGDPDDYRGGRGDPSGAGCASGASDEEGLLFRAESGVEMALEHSVVLVLDPGWSDVEVRRFLARNRIPQGCASPLGWIANGFTVATGPGIAALALANALAGQDGVVMSSPNWASEFETKTESDPPSRLSAPTITAVYPSDSSMTVTWEPPPDVDDETSFTYDISWLPSDQADDPDAEWTIAGGYSGWLTEVWVWSPLTNGTTYDVRMRAVSEVDGEWSETVTVELFERSDSPSDDDPAIPLDVPIGSVLDGTGFDVDLFKIVLTERKRLTLRTYGGSGEVSDTVCRLLDSEGILMPGTKSDDLDLPSRRAGERDRHCFVHASLAAGTYYFEVRGFALPGYPANLADRGRFRVRAATVPDPGTTAATAQSVPLNQISAGAFASRAETHFWRLDVAERQFIYVPIILLNTGLTRDVAAWLVDSSGERLDAHIEIIESCYIGCLRTGVRVKAELSAGTYYVVIKPRGANVVYAFERLIDLSYMQLVSSCRSLNLDGDIDDELSGCQWHLENQAQRGGVRGEDANVTAAHAAGYLGQGVHVAVVDSGFDLDHDDLAGNASSSRTRSYCGGDTAPFSNRSNHGSAVAGVIAARDNSIGMRGVAPRATLHNRRLLCDRTTIADLADAMTREMESLCVSNNSWSYSDDAGASPAAYAFDLAIDQGISSGCGGKGVVYVWSAGNGARVYDDSNLGELANYYGVTAVCAVNASGVRSRYSEAGANLWVCGPSNDSRSRQQPGVATLDNHDRYSDDFGGTSSAAPVVAGTAALVRAANNELTWRDVKLILAGSARQNRPEDSSWRQGAVKFGETGERYQYSRQYGFGVVDAHAAVLLAEEWMLLPAMITQTQSSDDAALRVPKRPASISSSVTFDAAIEFVEFVEVDTSFETMHLRDLRIELISPSGTEILVVPAAPWVSRTRTPLNEPFRFGVAGLLGEPADGTWTLRITDEGPGRQASLNSWGITLYGHRLRPSAPELAEVVADASTLTATWTAPEHTGPRAITGYELRHIATAATARADSDWTEVEVPGGADSFSHAFEAPAPGKYDVQVRAINDGGGGEWSGTITVVAPNTDPVFAVEAVTFEVAEDAAVGAAVGEPVVAVDGDGGAVLAYSLSGADAAGFSIDGATGQISVSSALDYEAPTDSDGDNAYELTVSVSDGLDSEAEPDASVDDSVAVTVEVTGVDEPLVLTAGDCALVVIYRASGDWECGFEAADPEGEAVVWSLSGDDAAMFALDAGVLSLVEAHDAGSPRDADGDSEYEVTVEVAAGGHTASADVSLEVVGQNRAPVFRGTAGYGGSYGNSINAPPGILVSIPLDKAGFIDPDGDDLAFEMTASRDDVHAAGDGVIYSEWSGRVFFLAKTACALAELDLLSDEVYETVVTMTATDPDGESASASVVFRTDLTYILGDRAVGACPSVSGASVDGSTLVVSLDGSVAPSFNRPTAADFTVSVDGAAVGVAGVDERARHAALILTLASPVAFGQTVTVSYAPDHSPLAEAFADQPAVNNTPPRENLPPVFGGTAAMAGDAPPGALTILPLDQSEFSDPDGDELTFTVSVSRDDVHIADGLTYPEEAGRVYFLAKTACALADLNPADGEVFETVVTMTATDPDGETAHASVTFRTDPSAHGCPSVSGAAVGGDTLVITLGGAVAPSLEPPTAAEFTVKVDGAAVSVAGVGEVAQGDTTITLTLASPVEAGQTVTASYAPGDNPIAAAFADQPATNNTAPVCVTALEGATAPICAAVSGKDLIVTFSSDLAAIDGATANALRFAIFVDGAFHNGAPVNSQSAGRIAIDGTTLTLTLGTAIRAGDEVTIRYFGSAADNGLKASNNTPIPDFTLTVTTTTQT